MIHNIILTAIHTTKNKSDVPSPINFTHPNKKNNKKHDVISINKQSHKNKF